METNLCHLKQTMGLAVLHCQRLVGVLKELTVFALVYNLVHVVMWAAAQQQGMALEQISFVDALRWLSTARPGEPLPPLVVNPHRPDRIEPRAVKRRPKPYPLLMKPRRVSRNTLMKQRFGAELNAIRARAHYTACALTHKSSFFALATRMDCA
jgi:hypothetical protein